MLNGPKILNASQLWRAVRTSERVFCCLVTKVNDDVHISTDCDVPANKEVINEPSDVILTGKDLPPAGLPPERPDLPQAIPLEPGTTPIAKPMYRRT